MTASPALLTLSALRERRYNHCPRPEGLARDYFAEVKISADDQLREFLLE